jgi:hypothetical protein
VADATETLCELFESSCVELFSGLDCQIQKLAADDSAMGKAPIAFIDAGSEDLELFIALHVPFSVLTMTYPEFAAESIMAVSEEVLEDWISELSNQLVGRFKHKLLQNSCAITIGLPDLLYDGQTDQLPVNHLIPHHFYFDVDKEIVKCSLYLQILKADLTLAPSQEDSGPAEGELEFF